MHTERNLSRRLINFQVLGVRLPSTSNNNVVLTLVGKLQGNVLLFIIHWNITVALVETVAFNSHTSVSWNQETQPANGTASNTFRILRDPDDIRSF